jgi:Mn2+/Fe2+ NRAMP family transporter
MRLIYIQNSKFKIQNSKFRFVKFEKFNILIIFILFYIVQMIQLNGSILSFILIITTIFLILYTNINQMERFKNKDMIEDDF